MWLKISQRDCLTDSDGLAEKAHGCENNKHRYKQIILQHKHTKKCLPVDVLRKLYVFVRWFLIEGFLIILHIGTFLIVNIFKVIIDND